MERKMPSLVTVVIVGEDFLSCLSHSSKHEKSSSKAASILAMLMNLEIILIALNYKR
jgi:hypothetical protein